MIREPAPDRVGLDALYLDALYLDALYLDAQRLNDLRSVPSQITLHQTCISSNWPEI